MAYSRLWFNNNTTNSLPLQTGTGTPDAQPGNDKCQYDSSSCARSRTRAASTFRQSTLVLRKHAQAGSVRPQALTLRYETRLRWGTQKTGEQGPSIGFLFLHLQLNNAAKTCRPSPRPNAKTLIPSIMVLANSRRSPRQHQNMDVTQTTLCAAGPWRSHSRRQQKSNCPLENVNINPFTTLNQKRPF